MRLTKTAPMREPTATSYVNHQSAIGFAHTQPENRDAADRVAALVVHADGRLV